MLKMRGAVKGVLTMLKKLQFCSEHISQQQGWFYNILAA